MSFTVLRYLAQTQPETHISTHSQLLPNQPIFFPQWPQVMPDVPEVSQTISLALKFLPS